MPTKQTARSDERAASADPRREKQVAYEAHTLAQMLYGQMMTRHGWPVASQQPATTETSGAQPHATWNQPSWNPMLWSRY